MRILIVHNILWAHYKASVFEALQQAVDLRPDTTLKVLQIARNERSRAGLAASPGAGTPVYTYDYELLFDDFLEDVGLPARTRALLRRAKAFRPDVINLTGYYDPAQLALLLWARVNGIRVIMQNESTVADQQRGGWKDRFKRWVLGRCDGFFCFGNQSANYLIDLGVPPEKILLRKNSVDNQTIRSVYERALPGRAGQQQALSLPAHNFVFVGRLLALKNLPVLLAAFAQARQQARQQATNATDWGLILLGDGPEEALLRATIDRLGLDSVVSLLPGRPWFEVPQVLALASVLVLPSTSEAWGLVVNEAMVCGLPVIVSDRCGCVPDLVNDGYNGFVFDPGAADTAGQSGELTRLLTQFMSNRVDVARMSGAARRSIASYAPEAVAQEMLAGFIKVTT